MHPVYSSPFSQTAAFRVMDSWAASDNISDLSRTGLVVSKHAPCFRGDARRGFDCDNRGNTDLSDLQSDQFAEIRYNQAVTLAMFVRFTGGNLVSASVFPVLVAIYEYLA